MNAKEYMEYLAERQRDGHFVTEQQMGEAWDALTPQEQAYYDSFLECEWHDLEAEE